jgi:hypothetical protein
MGITDVHGTYAANMTVGYAGMIADSAGPKDVASRTIENAVVAFGLAVGRGTADSSARLGGSGFEGITVADKSQVADEYPIGAVAGVVRKGTVWVTVNANVTPASVVRFVASTGVITPTESGGTVIAGAKFETTTTSGNLARVYLG